MDTQWTLHMCEGNAYRGTGHMETHVHLENLLKRTCANPSQICSVHCSGH
jgi:hypothetical protein